MIRSPSPLLYFLSTLACDKPNGNFPPLLRNYKIFLPKESHLLLSLDNSPSLFLPLFLSCPRTPACVCVCVILRYCVSRIRIVPGMGVQVTPISFQKVWLAEFIGGPGSEKNRISLCQVFEMNWTLFGCGIK